MTNVKATLNPKKPRANFGSLKALLPIVMRQRGKIILALIALVIAALATLAVPLAIRRMIDSGFKPENASFLAQYFGALIAVVAVLALASATRYYLVMTIGERVVADLRSSMFTHLSTLDAQFYDTAKAGEIVSRLTSDTTQIKSAFGSSASVALRNAVLFLGAVGLMIYTSPHLSSLVLIAIPLIVLPLVFAGRGVRERSRIAQERLAEAANFANEQIGASRTMQAFSAEKRVSGLFVAASDSAYEAARITIRSRSILTGIAIFMIFASVVAVLWVGAQSVMNDDMSAGLLSQFLFYAVFAASSLGQLSEVYSELSSAAGAATRLSELLNEQPAVKEPLNPVVLLRPVQGALRFENVSFAYPSRFDAGIISSLSLDIKHGERVALVGPSGAGKSTVLQLLMRFYDPVSGIITLDGVALPSLSLLDLRSNIAIVSQEPAIFGTSIIDNIRYAKPDASEAEIRHACERASADAFIMRLPEGYNTQIGERGVTLSGGERQRLAIARAILKDAPILLLDEATSALDAENEHLVQAALDGLMNGRTSLVIAHRLATILNANRILVMEQGKIVEQGTHAELVAKQGLYARLAELQFGVKAA
jgi:ATP-binding cassette, subfamily B, bacterial